MNIFELHHLLNVFSYHQFNLSQNLKMKFLHSLIHKNKVSFFHKFLLQAYNVEYQIFDL